MFVFSVTMICSDGYSRVGRYTDGRRFDALHTESAWNLLKLFLLQTGSPFRKSLFSMSVGLRLFFRQLGRLSAVRVKTSRCQLANQPLSLVVFVVAKTPVCLPVRQLLTTVTTHKLHVNSIQSNHATLIYCTLPLISKYSHKNRN